MPLNNQLVSDRIMVTGVGATSPVGGNVADTWSSIVSGRSGVVALEQEWASSLPTRLAAPMAVDPAGVLDRVKARRLDRSTQAALVAAREAWQDAGLAESKPDPDRVAVVFATGVGGLITLMDNHDQMLAGGYRKVSPRMIQMNMPNGSAAAISIEFGARAGAITPVSACASGAEALAHAQDLIRLGRADVVIAGGAEACIHPITMAGFAQARAMSHRNDDPRHASRPFDIARDGFVLGEGAAVVILETEAHAAARGRTAYAVLAGSAITSDAHDMVSPDPSGSGQVTAMRQALSLAGLQPTDVGHVNAHATSTPTGDMIEARAIAEVFGDHSPVVSATKSMTGHLLGASGALEAVLTVLAIHQDTAPPTPTLEDADPDLTLDVTRSEPRSVKIDAALSNSFGFGGHNAALVFTKPI